MVLSVQLVNLDSEDVKSIPIPVIDVGMGCSSREWKSWRRTVCPLFTNTMVKTARSSYYFSTKLASWE